MIDAIAIYSKGHCKRPWKSVELHSCGIWLFHLIRGQFNISYFSHESNFRLEGTDPQPEIRVIQSLSPLKKAYLLPQPITASDEAQVRKVSAINAVCSSEINPSTTYELWTLERCLFFTERYNLFSTPECVLFDISCWLVCKIRQSVKLSMLVCLYRGEC